MVVGLRPRSRRAPRSGRGLRPLEPAEELGTGASVQHARRLDRGEQGILVIAVAIGADLELAAVQEPEPLGARLGGRGPGLLLGPEALVELADVAPLPRDPLGIEAVGDREALGMVGDDLVGVA